MEIKIPILICLLALGILVWGQDEDYADEKIEIQDLQNSSKSQQSSDLPEHSPDFVDDNFLMCKEEIPQTVFDVQSEWSCCGNQMYRAGLKTQQFYQNCSGYLHETVTTYTEGYWQMYECLVENSLRDKSLTLYNFTDMMTENMSEGNRRAFFELIEQLNLQETNMRAELESVMHNFTSLKLEICKDVPWNETNDGDEDWREEIGILKCRNESYPYVPFFPGSAEQIEKCLGTFESNFEMDDLGEIHEPLVDEAFHKLGRGEQKLVCAVLTSGLIHYNEDEFRGQKEPSWNVTTLIPKFYSFETVSEILHTLEHGNWTENENNDKSNYFEQIINDVTHVARAIGEYCQDGNDILFDMISLDHDTEKNNGTELISTTSNPKKDKKEKKKQEKKAKKEKKEQKKKDKKAKKEKERQEKKDQKANRAQQ